MFAKPNNGMKFSRNKDNIRDTIPDPTMLNIYGFLLFQIYDINYDQLIVNLTREIQK